LSGGWQKAQVWQLRGACAVERWGGSSYGAAVVWLASRMGPPRASFHQGPLQQAAL